MNNERKEVIKTSKKKAAISAVIAPVVIFITMLLVDKNSSLGAVIVWYAFSTLVYITRKDKQLTAKYYFQDLIVVGLFLLPMILLAGLGLYIGHFL